MLLLPLSITFWCVSLLLRTACALVTYALLTVGLTMAYRVYKIYLPVWFTRYIKSSPGDWSSSASSGGLVLRPIKPDQCVLITGATSGIGLALAKYLHSRGYTVFAGYYDAQEPGYLQIKQLSERGDSRPNRIELVEMDIRQEQSIAQAAQRVASLMDTYTSSYGTRYELYALINNAGLGSLQPFAWLQRSRMRALIETNLLGNLLVSREFISMLASSSSGRSSGSNNNGQPGRPSRRLLFTSSGLGIIPGATYATYGVTKVGHLYIAMALNRELKHRYNIDCIAMVPHNFVKNTNICAANVKTNQLAWDELKPVERRLYKDEVDEQIELAKSLELAVKERHQQSESAPANERNNQSRNNNCVGQFFKSVADSLNAVNSALTLEQSGALEKFEWALRLESPPEHMFAGDTIYDLLVGSLILSLPISCAGLLGKSASTNLYK